MKKKVFVSIFALILCFVVVGCDKKEENNNNQNNSNENNKAEEQPKLADDEVELEGIKYKLDQDEEGYGIKYKIASNFRKTVLTNAINYFSEKINDSSYFVIRIYKYPNKSIDYAIKDSVESYEEKSEVQVGDLKYTKVRFTNYNGAKTNLYYYKHKNTVYTFVFTAGIDLSRLEDIFLKNINY